MRELGRASARWTGPGFANRPDVIRKLASGRVTGLGRSHGVVNATSVMRKTRRLEAVAFALLLAVPIDVRAQDSDSTYSNVLALELDRLPSPVATHFSHGYQSRAAALQRGARHLRNLLIDSLAVEPAAVELIVLDERDWGKVTDLPYGLHTLLERRSAFLAPAVTDRGIYHSEELSSTEAGLRVDVIGLHYLAHFFAAQAVYGDGGSDPPVKWLDELLTLMLQDELLGTVDPAVLEAGRRFERESLELTDPRVRTLEEFDREYRGYFVTREGGANYAWFLARIAAWSRAVRQAHGLKIFEQVGSELSASGFAMDSPEAFRMLEALGVDMEYWR